MATATRNKARQPAGLNKYLEEARQILRRELPEADFCASKKGLALLKAHVPRVFPEPDVFILAVEEAQRRVSEHKEIYGSVTSKDDTDFLDKTLLNQFSFYRNRLLPR